MAMKRAASSAIRSIFASSSTFTRNLHAPGEKKKIVGVFYKGNEYASNPNFVGCVERALGIREWLESQGHEYIVTDDKEGPDCELEKHLPDLHVLISTPFHPAYVTAERIKKAKNLELLLTAGIGSDHIDLKAAAAAGLTVAEVTGSNVVSVAEDELLRILVLVRNFLPGYHQAVKGEWNVAGIAHRAYDLEGKTIGTVGAGRIGKLLLQRLKPFNCNLLYFDRVRMDHELEKEIGVKFEEDLDAMLPKCDVIVINMPLTEQTRGLFDKNRIAKCKKGVVIVNNARGAIMDTQAIADACSSGHVAGYGGDVWPTQPAPKDHPWRYMPNHAMTPHISGTTIDAQLRYAAGVKDMLDRHFRGEDFPKQNYIVKEGQLASQYRYIVTHAMAMKRVASSAVRLLASSSTFARNLHAPGEKKKIVGVFYKGNEYASLNPNFVGCVEGALGIREWLESQGHQYIVTDDKEGPDSELEKHLPDLHVLISTPFHPAYVTAERIKKAKNLELLLTAGIGSDHIDLNAAAAAGLTVAEVTGSNVVSVAEDELMRILILVRNFLPGYHQAVNGEWNVAGIAHRAYDLEGKTVGTVAAGRIGRLLLQRLKPFNCNLLYFDRVRMDSELEKEIGVKFEEELDAMLPKCDVVVINTPLTEQTRGLFDKDRIAKCKKGVLIVNNARGAIMDTQALADACSSGHVAGYSGDVWPIQPAPKDHPWRYMPNHAMTPHISGTTIDAQLRYAAGVKDMLDRHFRGEDFPAQNYIVKEGQLASQYR
ncbi:hypothetical protein Fmac_016859 [Flemingia macrophylla]|uniref:Formate dehydrogenase, mitochondrial n=1 Tax=Flemingia macrophylla TaxID=520843 RepID=A0ABD1MIN3_9FABA